jgi:hypothetical protein
MFLSIPWRWPFEGWNMSEWYRVNKVALILNVCISRFLCEMLIFSTWIWKSLCFYIFQMVLLPHNFLRNFINILKVLYTCYVSVQCNNPWSLFYKFRICREPNCKVRIVWRIALLSTCVFQVRFFFVIFSLCFYAGRERLTLKLLLRYLIIYRNQISTQHPLI